MNPSIDDINRMAQMFGMSLIVLSCQDAERLAPQIRASGNVAPWAAFDGMRVGGVKVVVCDIERSFGVTSGAMIHFL
jgi:hypothetical protein